MELIQPWTVACNDLVHCDLADNVVNLAAGKIILPGKGIKIVVLEPVKLGLPDLLLSFHRRILELDLEEETALKSTIQVSNKVGGGNHDAVQLLHLLKNDVLHGVLGLGRWAQKTVLPSGEDSVCLVEEQDRCPASFLLKACTAELAVVCEDYLDFLLALTEPSGL